LRCGESAVSPPRAGGQLSITVLTLDQQRQSVMTLSGAAVDVVARTARMAGDRVAGFAERPRLVLGVLAAAQLAVTIVFGLSVRHNGLVWFQGGDQIWYTTTGWLLGELDLPMTLVGYGWPVVLAPIMLLTGIDYVGALPLILPLNVFVLAPLLVAAFYGLATRIAGRLFALWAGAVWIVLPLLAIVYFNERYRENLVEVTMPQGYGLTAMADFPSMVAVTLAAVLVLRSIELDAPWEAALAGLIAGFAIGVKPSNSLFLAGPAVAYLIALRWRPALSFGSALLPALLTLAVWKQRGLGEIPLFSLDETRQAVGGSLVVAETWFDRFVPLDWGVFKDNMAQLREFSLSARLIQFVPFAGAVAVARRSFPAAGLLFAWLLAYVVVKGSSPVAMVENASFFRLLMPAWPAYAMLAAALPLLVPGVNRRLSAVRPTGVVSPRLVVAAVVLLAVIPLVLVSIAQPLGGPKKAVRQSDEVGGILTPVDDRIGLRTKRDGESVLVTWDAPSYGVDTYFVLYRTPLGGPDVACSDAGAAACTLQMLELSATNERTHLDGSPPPGVTYRVGVATSNRGSDTSRGEVFVISPPLRLAP
jgi:hypothetical protein